MSLKLEAILTELLAQFWQNHQYAKAVMVYYLRYYGIERNNDGDFHWINARNYLYIIKNRCRMTLGDLMFEVFNYHTPRKKEYPQNAVYPARVFRWDRHAYPLFKNINTLRSTVAHYGQNTHESTLGLLTPQQAENIMKWFMAIIDRDRFFSEAYPNTAQNVSTGIAQ